MRLNVEMEGEDWGEYLRMLDVLVTAGWFVLTDNEEGDDEGHCWFTLDAFSPEAIQP